mgnify:CR=1 FL=1
MALRLIKAVCIALFVAGIPSLIVSSIAGNNEGWVLTFGMITAIAAIVLMSVSAATNNRRLDAFDEVAAERLESRVQALIGAGVDENEVRAVVRDAIDLGRGRG